MKEFKQKILIGLVTLFLLLTKAGSFLTTEELAGRDLIGAYSLVESFGFYWSTDWFLGFPLFEFYPPGFFFLANTLGHLIGNLNSFKLLVFTSLVLIPAVLYYSLEKMFDSETGLIGGFIGIFLIFMREPLSLLYQTLQVGLVAQIFGLLTFILFASTLWGEKRDSAYLSSLLLASTILFHPFLGLVASLYLVIYFVLSRNVLRFLMASMGYALSAWWWLPALEKLWYTQLYTGPTGKLVNLPWIVLPFLFFINSKKALSFVLTGLLLVLLGSFELIPLQYYRAFIYGQIILIIGACPGIKNSIDKLYMRLEPQKMMYFIGLVLILAALTVDVTPEWNSNTSLENVTPENGQVLVETSHNDLHESYVPIQKMPLDSNSTVVNGLYADSSISSPYLLGLEKTVSKNPVPNPIAIESDLNSSQVKKRMSYLGIDYILLRKPVVVTKLAFMEKVSENKDFSLLSHDSSDSEMVENVITVSGPRKEWEELNTYIFRNELVTNIVYLHDEEADYKLNELTNEQLIQKAKNSETNTNVKIEKESIRPTDNIEAVFGLKPVYTN